MKSTLPNILILMTDQQRWDALGANLNSEIRTPNLDRLAAEGVNFDHCFVQYPVCMPSRVSMLTGQYHTSDFCERHPGTRGYGHTSPLLKNYGYTSANIGKLHFLSHACRDHRQPHPSYGFDYLEISDEPGCYEDAYRAWVRVRAPDQLDLISVGLPPATEVFYRIMGIEDGIRHPEVRCPKRALTFRGRDDLTHTAFVAERTIEYLRTHRNQPFLCIAGFYSPHSPWITPRRFLNMYEPSQLFLPVFPPELDARRKEGFFSDDELRSARHGYYAMVTEVDYHIGRILDCLEELGLAEDTIIVFTSDHGEWLGEHLKYGKGFHAPDCISRVPLIVCWRERGVKGRVVHGIVEAVDIVPTLLECAGIPLPPHIQGRSFLQALLGDEFGEREMLFDLEQDPSA